MESFADLAALTLTAVQYLLLIIVLVPSAMLAGAWVCRALGVPGAVTGHRPAQRRKG